MRQRNPSNYVKVYNSEPYITVPTFLKHSIDQEAIRIEALNIPTKPYYTLGSFDVDGLLRTIKHPVYYGLVPASCGIVVGEVFGEIKSFEALLKDWIKNPSRDRPNPPSFKKNDKLHKMSFAIKKQIKIKDGLIHFPSLTKFGIKDIEPFKIPDPITGDIKLVSFVPNKKAYDIIISYTTTHQDLIPYKDGTWMGIDPGTANILTIETAKNSTIISGAPFLSEQKLYMEKKAKMHSAIMSIKENTRIVKGNVVPKPGVLNTKRLKAMDAKHKNVVNNFVHKVSSEIIDICKDQGITKIFFGHNKGIKQNTKKGDHNGNGALKNKKSRKQFASIPHYIILQKLQYKAKLIGIEVIDVEESYTSLTSALDNEPIGYSEKYIGKRIKRGLFKSGNGTIINADTNGALNIARRGHDQYLTKNDTNVQVPVIWSRKNPKKLNILK